MVRSLADLDEPNLEQQLSQLKPLLQGLHFSMQLSAPQVVETNLDQKDNAVRFHYDYASLLGKKTGKDQLSAFRALLVEKRAVFTTPKATTSK